MILPIGTYVEAEVYDLFFEASFTHFGVITERINHRSGFLYVITKSSGITVQALAARTKPARRRSFNPTQAG